MINLKQYWYYLPHFVVENEDVIARPRRTTDKPLWQRHSIGSPSLSLASQKGTFHITFYCIENFLAVYCLILKRLHLFEREKHHLKRLSSKVLKMWLFYDPYLNVNINFSKFRGKIRIPLRYFRSEFMRDPEPISQNLWRTILKFIRMYYYLDCFHLF